MQVQSSDNRWQDFDSIKTLLIEKLNNMCLIFLAKSDQNQNFSSFPIKSDTWQQILNIRMDSEVTGLSKSI